MSAGEFNRQAQPHTITPEEGVTMLFDAAHGGDVEAARALVAAGLPVDARNEFGDTPLILAVHRGHYEMAQALLDMKADPNAANTEGFNPLYYGVRQNAAMLELLFANGATYPKGKAPALAGRLTEAVFSGYENVVDAALAAGADPNIVIPECDDGRLLHFAARNAKPRMVRSLIAAGADVNALDKSKRSVLRGALNGGDLECVTAILDAGADTRNRSWDQTTGRTISDESASVNCDFDIAHAVVEAAKKFNLLDAALKGDSATVYNILADGIPPDKTLDEAGNTALYRACVKGHAEAAKALIEYGANVHFCPKDSADAMFVAVLSNSPECVRVLGDAGASVMTRTPSGTTAAELIDQVEPAPGLSPETKSMVRKFKAVEVDKMAQNAIRLENSVAPMAKLRLQARAPAGI